MCYYQTFILLKWDKGNGYNCWMAHPHTIVRMFVILKTNNILKNGLEEILQNGFTLFSRFDLYGFINCGVGFKICLMSENQPLTKMWWTELGMLWLLFPARKFNQYIKWHWRIEWTWQKELVMHFLYLMYVKLYTKYVFQVSGWIKNKDSVMITVIRFEITSFHSSKVKRDKT